MVDRISHHRKSGEASHPHFLAGPFYDINIVMAGHAHGLQIVDDVLHIGHILVRQADKHLVQRHLPCQREHVFPVCIDLDTLHCLALPVLVHTGQRHDLIVDIHGFSQLGQRLFQSGVLRDYHDLDNVGLGREPDPKRLLHSEPHQPHDKNIQNDKVPHHQTGDVRASLQHEKECHDGQFHKDIEFGDRYKLDKNASFDKLPVPVEQKAVNRAEQQKPDTYHEMKFRFHDSGKLPITYQDGDDVCKGYTAQVCKEEQIALDQFHSTIHKSTSRYLFYHIFHKTNNFFKKTIIIYPIMVQY